MPDNATGLVIFQHGITSNKDAVFAIANTLAGYGFATISTDMWGHGERTYEDTNTNGILADDSGAAFLRPDNPSLTVGYFSQSQYDLFRLRDLLKYNNELTDLIGNTFPIIISSPST